MIEVLLTVIPSICWMLFRCYQLLTTPTDRLARRLNVEIPHSPCVSVDDLGDTYIVMHWDIQMCPEENIYYVILVNGKDAGTLAQTSVRLGNLLPNTVYKIQVLAVNAISNFRLQSPAVFVHTDVFAEKTEKKTKLDITSDPSLISSKTKLPFSVVTEVELPSAHPPKSTNYLLDLSADEVANVTDTAVLAEYHYIFQNELKRAVDDMQGLTRSLLLEETRLRQELDNYRKELEEGSEIRAQRDLDIRDMEKKKDLLTFDKLKITKEIKMKEKNRLLHVNNVTELRLKVSKLRERKIHIDNSADNERTRYEHKVSEVSKEIAETKNEIMKIEVDVKTLSNNRKDLALAVQTLVPLVTQFVTPPPLPAGPNTEYNGSLEIFTRESSLTELGSEVLGKIYAIRPDWEPEVSRELEILSNMDTAWKSSFKAAIRKYVAMQNAAESTRATQDPSYIPQKMTEYQASVEFGGFGNAISQRRHEDSSSLDALLWSEENASLVSVNIIPSTPLSMSQSSVNVNGQMNKMNMSQISMNQGSMVNTGLMNKSLTNISLTNISQRSVANTSKDSMSQTNVNGNRQKGDMLRAEMAAFQQFKYPETIRNENYVDSDGFQNLDQDRLIASERYAGFDRYLHSDQKDSGYLENYYDKYPETYQDPAQNTFQNAPHDNVYDHAYRDNTFDYSQYQNVYDNASRENIYHDNYDHSYEKNDMYQDNNSVNSRAYDAYARPMGPVSSANFINELDTPIHQVPLAPISMSQPLSHLASQMSLASMIPPNVPHIQSTPPQQMSQSISLTIPPSMQQYAQNIRQTFPHDEFVRLTTPDAFKLQALWTLNQNFLDLRRTYLGLSLLPSSANLELFQTPSQLLVPHDSNLLNSILLSHSSSQLQSNIWLDRPLNSSIGHQRAVSNTSQLWRNETRDISPNMGITSDFLPFSPIKDARETENENSDRVNSSF